MKKLICFLLPILILVSCQSGPEPLVASKVDLIPSVYPISSAIEPGPTETGLYRTVTPFEHANVGRTHVYPADFGGSLSVPESNAVVVRQFSGVHETPYNIVTRNRDELFLFGGTQGRRDDAKGPYVVKFDATTGQVLWRTDLRDTKALGEFLWPGLVTVHGNGDLYAIHGIRIVRLDPATGTVRGEVELPTPDGFAPEDITYNGFSVLRSGIIVTKSFGRRGAEGAGFPPSIVVTVDPNNLTVIDSYQLAEGSAGRLTVGLFQGDEYVYVPGIRNIFRFAMNGSELRLDDRWSVSDYVRPGQGAASAPVVMGDWIVFQTNSGPSTAPLSVYAVSQADAGLRLRTEPFSPGANGFSFIPSALTVDPETMRIYSMDAGRGQIGCIELVGGERLETRWVVDQTTMNHTSLVGSSDARVFVSTDAPNLLAARAAARAAGRQTAGYEEQVVWRSAASGEELARSDFMPPKLIGDPLAPGFFGVWYYLGAAGDVYELKVE